MSKVEFDKKVALFIDGKRITKYIYNWGKEDNGIICMGNYETMDVYDADSGEFKFAIKDVWKVKIVNSFIIVTTSFDFVGVYDFNGNVILPLLYRKIYAKDSYFIVKDKEECAALLKYENNKIKTIIPVERKFTELRLCDEGVITYSEECGRKISGVYSYDGEEIVPTKYKEISFNREAISVQAHNGLKGIYSYNGNLIVPIEYGSIKKYHNCYIVTFWDTYHHCYGLYTKEGKRVLAPRYTHYNLSVPFVYFYKDGMVCLYNLINGKRILPLQYVNIIKNYNVLVTTKDYRRYTLHSAETGRLLVDEAYDRVELLFPYVLVVEKENEHNKYYLTKYNTFVSRETYMIKYEKDEGNFYIRERVKGSEWKLYEKE